MVCALAADKLPQDWLAAIPGRGLVGLHVLVVDDQHGNPALFWARALWDPDVTLYAHNIAELRQRVRNFWEVK